MKTRLKMTKGLALGLLMGLAGVGAGVAQNKLEEAPLVDGLKDLKVLSRQLVEMAEPCSAATVSLVSRGGGGAGSGVIVSEDGLILTAAHVVAAMTDEIIVIFPDGTRKEAKPLGADFDRDAAMVQITEKDSYPFVELGDSGALMRNQWCVALGHPGGFDPNRTPPVRLGRVLRVNNFVVTDCAVVGGDSGGPLFDVEGRMIGIHSNIGATLSENRHVPVDVYRDQWDSLKKGERSGKRFAGKQSRENPNRPMLGVRLGEPGKSGGVAVQEVMKESPAAKAGLKAGDVLLSVNAKKTDSAEQLIKVVSAFKPGKSVKVKLSRDGKEQEVEVKLARLKDLEDKEEPKKEQPDKEKSEGEAPKEDPKDQGPKEGGDDGKDDLDLFLDKALDGKSGGMKLQLTPEEMERFGGMDRIMKRIKERLGEEGSEETEEPEEKPDAKKPEEGREEGKDVAGDAMKKMLEEALKNDGRLELTPEKLDELGGMQEFAKRLRKMAETMDPKDLQKLMQGQVTMAPDKFFESSMKALQPVVAKTSGATVVVLVDGKPVALGTMVSADGRVLTKDTETRKGKVSVKLGDKTSPATLVQRFSKRDLALYQVEQLDGLKPVRWAKTQREPRLGSLLTAAGANAKPLGIGLVSVKTRALAGVGFLGVRTSAAEDGVKVEEAVDGGPAAKAGLKGGDVIVGINGKKAGEPHEFGQAIRAFRVGDEVNLKVRTGDKTRSVKVKLAERPTGRSTGRFQRMNEMSGPMSERLSGFPQALQHDIPLDPVECGGPLLDLSGRCLGINVSRAGRVKTLAIPAADVRELLASVKEPQETAPAKPAETEVTAADIAEMEKMLDSVRETLKDLEERLEKMEAR